MELPHGLVRLLYHYLCKNHPDFFNLITLCKRSAVKWNFVSNVPILVPSSFSTF